MQNNIDYLISPISQNDFFGQYWDKNLLHIKRNDPAYFIETLPLQELDDYLCRSDIRYPSIRMSKSGKTLELNDYTDLADGEKKDFAPKVNVTKLFSCFHNGATIVLQRMKYSLKSLAALTSGLEKSLGFRTETNVYITPPSSQGFQAHYDRHNVLILQISGVKKWNLYDIKRQLPLNDEEYYPFDYSNHPPNKVIDLHPGDVLYIPRGMVHDAVTSDGPSIHVALTLSPLAWTELLRDGLHMQKDSELLGSPILNIGKDVHVANSEEFTAVLKQYLDSVEF